MPLLLSRFLRTERLREMPRIQHNRQQKRRYQQLRIEEFEPRRLMSADISLSSGVDDVSDYSNPTLAESSYGSDTNPTSVHDEMIGASLTRSLYNVDGSGLAVAVIDSGIIPDHPAFEKTDGTVIKGGYDFSDDDTDPSATDLNAPHGTAVAGIIASQDPENPGVAPGASVVPLRVFGNDGRGSFDWIADSLQWVIDNHEEYNISVVNLSISDLGNYAPPFLPYNSTLVRLDSLIGQLEELKIPVIAATGNRFEGAQGVGFTATIEETISVTGLDGPNKFAEDAQRLGESLGGIHATDLAAPGRDVTGAWTNNSFAELDGTSFAAPLVSGGILLLQEIYVERFGELPTVDQLESWLEGGAPAVYDSVTGITIGRLNIPAAATLIPEAPRTVELLPEESEDNSNLPLTPTVSTPPSEDATEPGSTTQEPPATPTTPDQLEGVETITETPSVDNATEPIGPIDIVSEDSGTGLLTVDDRPEEAVVYDITDREPSEDSEQQSGDLVGSLIDDVLNQDDLLTASPLPVPVPTPEETSPVAESVEPAPPQGPTTARERLLALFAASPSRSGAVRNWAVVSTSQSSGSQPATLVRSNRVRAWAASRTSSLRDPDLAGSSWRSRPFHRIRYGL